MPENPSLGPQRTVDHVPTPETPSTVDDTGAGRPAGSTEPHLSAPPVDAPSLPGYRITAEIARGGMGRVYAGYDLTLDREVAIKMLLGGADAERFVTEAKITARLPHPAIPPVHALGTLADGTPYLTMKLIRGHTLAELLQKRLSPLDGLPRFVQIFEQIAQAVGFAHAHGIIHRDLKPLNVMVGALGEVQVMDWGLAKHLASGERLRPEQLPADENVSQTAAGAILGTPGYMAPEQARGEVVDARADVFSLGATLAVILTGKPAFVGASKGEVIEKATRADLADVHKRLTNSGADGELIALALSCLSVDVAQRPVDGRAVAALVAAYRAGVEARLKQAETERAEALVREAEQRKWRRTVQVAAGVIASVLLAGLGVSLWQMFRAVDAEGQANQNLKAEQQARADETMARQQAVLSEQRAEQERSATEAARRRTRQALDEMSSQVIEDWLSRRGQLEPAQRAFLKKALSYYEDFARESGSSEEVRAAVADANLRVANMRSRLGQHPEAETAYRRAVDLYANLAEKFPTGPEYHHKLAGSCTSLGHLLTDTGRAPEAESAYRKALTIRQQLVADFPTVAEYRQALGASHNNLGILFKDTGRSREAESAYREALAIRQQLAAEYPTVPQYRQQLGAIYNNLGYLLVDTGRPAEAKSAYSDALKVQKQLAADFTTIPQFRVELARSYNNLGNLLKDTDHAEEAQSVFRDALTIQKGLAAEFPAIPQYRQELAATHLNLGNLLKKGTRLQEAESEYRDALAIFRPLASDFPSLFEYQADLATTLDVLALLARDRKDYPVARRLLEEARRHVQRALDSNPRRPLYRLIFCNIQRDLAATLLDVGEYAAAAEAAGELSRIAFEPAGDAYQAACFFSRCVVLAETDNRLPQAQRQELAKTHGDRAVAALREAVAKGYADVANVRKEKDLDPLRPRPDFQKLIAELEKAAAQDKSKDKQPAK